MWRILHKKKLNFAYSSNFFDFKMLITFNRILISSITIKKFFCENVVYWVASVGSQCWIRCFNNAWGVLSGCSDGVGLQQCVVSFLSSSANGEFPPVVPTSPTQVLFTPSNENIKTTTPLYGGPGAFSLQPTLTECEFSFQLFHVLEVFVSFSVVTFLQYLLLHQCN